MEGEERAQGSSLKRGDTLEKLAQRIQGNVSQIRKNNPGFQPGTKKQTGLILSWTLEEEFVPEGDLSLSDNNHSVEEGQSNGDAAAQESAQPRMETEVIKIKSGGSVPEDLRWPTEFRQALGECFWAKEILLKKVFLSLNPISQKLLNWKNDLGYPEVSYEELARFSAYQGGTAEAMESINQLCAAALESFCVLLEESMGPDDEDFSTIGPKPNGMPKRRSAVPMARRKQEATAVFLNNHRQAMESLPGMPPAPAQTFDPEEFKAAMAARKTLPEKQPKAAKEANKAGKPRESYAKPLPYSGPDGSRNTKPGISKLPDRQAGLVLSGDIAWEKLLNPLGYLAFHLKRMPTVSQVKQAFAYLTSLEQKAIDHNLGLGEPKTSLEDLLKEKTKVKISKGIFRIYNDALKNLRLHLAELMDVAIAKTLQGEEKMGKQADAPPGRFKDFRPTHQLCQAIGKILPSVAESEVAATFQQLGQLEQLLIVFSCPGSSTVRVRFSELREKAEEGDIKQLFEAAIGRMAKMISAMRQPVLGQPKPIQAEVLKPEDEAIVAEQSATVVSSGETLASVTLPLAGASPEKEIILPAEPPETPAPPAEEKCFSIGDWVEKVAGLNLTDLAAIEEVARLCFPRTKEILGEKCPALIAAGDAQCIAALALVIQQPWTPGVSLTIPQARIFLALTGPEKLAWKELAEKFDLDAKAAENAFHNARRRFAAISQGMQEKNADPVECVKHLLEANADKRSAPLYRDRLTGAKRAKQTPEGKAKTPKKKVAEAVVPASVRDWMQKVQAADLSREKAVLDLLYQVSLKKVQNFFGDDDRKITNVSQLLPLILGAGHAKNSFSRAQAEIFFIACGPIDLEPKEIAKQLDLSQATVYNLKYGARLKFSSPRFVPALKESRSKPKEEMSKAKDEVANSLVAEAICSAMPLEIVADFLTDLSVLLQKYAARIRSVAPKVAENLAEKRLKLEKPEEAFCPPGLLYPRPSAVPLKPPIVEGDRSDAARFLRKDSFRERLGVYATVEQLQQALSSLPVDWRQVLKKKYLSDNGSDVLGDAWVAKELSLTKPQIVYRLKTAFEKFLRPALLEGK